MSARLLVILFFLFVLYLVVKTVIGFVYLSSQRRKRRERLGGEMVKDPICETYIPKAAAIAKYSGGQTVYFCSQECADVYLKKNG
ncbi:MAG: hypothetical protein HY204_12745 [Nitrospirae bacterium]|nr:hypothetical protein [Nitrospirota bacterium]